jgi:hypothetical protein
LCRISQVRKKKQELAYRSHYWEPTLSGTLLWLFGISVSLHLVAMATLSIVASGSQLRSKTTASSALDSFSGQRVVGAIPTRGSWRRGVVVAIRAGASDSVDADNGRFLWVLSIS